MTTPLESLRDMVTYIRKVGGYMTAEDQIKLRDAEHVLRDADRKFDVTRHGDPLYRPPYPWNGWDERNRWLCVNCGELAVYQQHAPDCPEFKP